jgi:cytoskeleton protein RodZ
MAPHADSGFGASMRRVREDRGISLRQIAEATKLSVTALEALERNDISRLPGGIFSRAFVRSYASEIGVDPEQAVRDFVTQFPHDSVLAGTAQAHQKYDLEELKSRVAPATIAAVVVLTVLLGAIVFLTLSSRF